MVTLNPESAAEEIEGQAKEDPNCRTGAWCAADHPDGSLRAGLGDERHFHVRQRALPGLVAESSFRVIRFSKKEGQSKITICKLQIWN